MAGEAKAKVIIGAETAEFNKGIRAARADMKAFGDVSDDILGKLGSALGIDTKQVEQMSSAIRGMGMKLGQAGGEGATAFKKIVTGASAAGAAIAGLGLAGALVAFKALTSEAENFKTTLAGANIEMQTAAFVQTYTQVMHDFSSATGAAVAETESKWKKFWGTLGSNIKAYFASGAFAEDMNPWGNSTTGTEQYNALRNAAEQAGTEAARISGEIFKIDRQRSENLVRIAELERTIAESQRIMKDDSSTLAEKNDAYAKATQAINDKYALQLPLMKQRAALLQEMVGLAGSTVEQVDAANQASADAINLEARQEDELRSLERLAKGITTANRQTNAALKEQLTLQQQIAASRAETAAWIAQSGAPSLNAQQLATTSAQGGGIILPEINPIALQEQINAALGGSLFLEVGININKASVLDMSRQVESILGGLAESMSSAIGGLVGDLVTGGDAWSNFANAALSAFGDMAISVGKIAIEAGIATLGIKAALATLGPAGAAMAIGAGSALVLLGSAVKAGMSNVANGNYSASTGVASSGYGTAYGDGFETREVEIKVTGNLVADGNQLKAVINNVDKQNGYTT